MLVIHTQSWQLKSLHPVKNIPQTAQQEREKREPGTHWAFSHQPMVPCTPPEFLKMASHPPTPPAQRTWIVHLCSAVSFHCWDKNHNSPGLPDLVKSHHIEAVFLQLVSLRSMYCKWLAERKTPLCGLYVPELSCEIKPKTVIEMVVLDKMWRCDHTYHLFNLGQIMQRWDTLFRFASSLWKFINDKTVQGSFWICTLLKVQLKLNLMFLSPTAVVDVSINFWIQSETDLWRTYLN